MRRPSRVGRWWGAWARVALAAGVAVVSGCGTRVVESPAAPAGPSRGFRLGLTAFPDAATGAADAFAWQAVDRDADLTVVHWDDGIPWQEALAGTPYDPGFEAEIQRRRARLPADQPVFLTLTPIAFARDGLAGHRGAQGNEPLAAPWDRFAFDDPAVVTAFLGHAERMIATFQPRYLAYAIEANLLARLAPQRWPEFVRFAHAVYPRLRAAHPDLPILVTLQVDTFHSDPVAQTGAVRQILDVTDMIAASSYPFTDTADPAALRGDHFSALAALAPDKPFAVSETCWPAEDVTDPAPLFVPSSEAAQQVYVQRLLDDAERLDAVFVTWFFPRDFDALWDDQARFLELAPLVRLWKDCGLYAGDGSPRPALQTWRAALARPLG